MCIHIVMSWTPLLSHVWGPTLVMCNYGTNALMIFRAAAIIYYIKQDLF